MISASLKTQNKGIDMRLNESDKLLSDKYILAKDIRDLNRTLQDSSDKMNLLEDEVINKLKLIEQLEQYIHAFDKIQKESGLLEIKNEASTDLLPKSDNQIEESNKTIEIRGSQIQKLNDIVKYITKIKGGSQHKINVPLEKLNTEPDLQELKETIKNKKTDFVSVKQLIIDNNHQLKDEIRILREAIKNRNNANLDALVERDNLKVQMRNIIEEIAGHKCIKNEER